MFLNLRRILPIILVLVVLNFSSYSQTISRDVICATGNTFVNQDMSVTYILGETVGDLFSSRFNTIFFTAGFAQPDVNLQEVIAANTYLNHGFVVFPSPASSSPTVKLAFRHTLPNGKYSISLISALGRLIETKEVYYTPASFAYQEFNVSKLANGVYFFRVLGENNFKTAISFVK